MKLSTLTPTQEFILKMLRFDNDMYVGIANNTPKMYQGKHALFNVYKLSFDNLVTLGHLVKVGDKWLLNRF